MPKVGDVTLMDESFGRFLTMAEQGANGGDKRALAVWCLDLWCANDLERIWNALSPGAEWRCE